MFEEWYSSILRSKQVIHLYYARPSDRNNILFSPNFHLKFSFQIFSSFRNSSGALIKFMSSTYTVSIVNLDSDVFMNTHEAYKNFNLYAHFMMFSLRQSYHILPNCFKPYKNHCNFIEHKLREFELYAYDILNPSEIILII